MLSPSRRLSVLASQLGAAPLSSAAGSCPNDVGPTDMYFSRVKKYIKVLQTRALSAAANGKPITSAFAALRAS